MPLLERLQHAGIVDEADSVLVDEPGWSVEYARLAALGMRILPVPRLADGPDLDVMRKLIEAQPAQQKPRLYVTVSVLRTIAGAAFLGSVTDAMLLGHWYLVQPGLPRRHLNELVQVVGWVWPVEVAALLLPTGMFSVWTGAVDDGWNGTLGWFWGACAVTTIVLVFVTKAALRERYYSAVMAATGLLYLAILTAFGTDLVARAVLAG